MNYLNNIPRTFRGKSIHPMATTAIISGVALGVAVGFLLTTEKGRNVRRKIADFTSELFGGTTRKAKAGNKLSEVISDVRTHVKKNADGLLGSPKKRQNPSAIHVDHTTTNAWKEQPAHQTVKAKPVY